MQFYINPRVTETIVRYSRAIAQERGYPVETLVLGLQNREELEKKRDAEYQEMQKAASAGEMRAEAADFCRYSILLDVVAPVAGKPHWWYIEALVECHKYGFDQEEIEVAMRIKYGIRHALPYRKERETPDERERRERTELAAIQAAIDTLQDILIDEPWPGWALPEVAEMYDIPLPTLYKLATKPYPAFIRKAGKTTLFNLYHPKWRRWINRYQFRERKASNWPDPSQGEHTFS